MTRERDQVQAPAPRKARSRRPASAKAAASSLDFVDELAPDDARLREFIADFSAASASMRILRRSLAEALDLTTAEHSVMLGLWYCERKSEISVRELADHLHVAAAHVTAELGKLEEAGLIEKKPSASDKRAVNVRLTRKGHQLLDRLAPMLRDVNLSLLAGMDFDEMAAAHRFLNRVIKQAPEAIRIVELWTTLKRRGQDGL